MDPAAAEGHRLVAVAASSRERAVRFAAAHGVERVLDDYQAVIDDPEVDVIYNPLVNSLHTRWNLRALAAGKRVLSEKPLAVDAAEARTVRDAVHRSAGTPVEAFHYLHHPSVRRIEEIIRAGRLGDIVSVDIVLDTENPGPSDPRWSWELAGGATMDLGCYVLHAHRQLARWLEVPEPRVGSASSVAWIGDRRVDASMTVELDYLDGVPTTARWDMDAPERRMTWTVHGSKGTLLHPAFAVPHLDNRLLLTIDGQSTVETIGNTTSYTYQLRRLAEALDGGPAFGIDVDDAVANAELIDAVYQTAGLLPRPEAVE